MSEKQDRRIDQEVIVTRTDLRAISRFFSAILDHPVLEEFKVDACLGRGLVLPLKICDVRIVEKSTQNSSGCRLDPTKPTLTVGGSYCFCNDTGKKVKLTFPSDDVFGQTTFEFDIGESKSLTVKRNVEAPIPSLHFKIHWWMGGAWHRCTGQGNGAEMKIVDP